jgi:diguanylate cyclase (GGDEF)-like protein
MHPLARPDFLSLVVHIAGTAVFAGVFSFLYRESRIVYFGYWAQAWAVLAAALTFNLASLATGRTVLLYPYALMELAFSASIIFAAASVSGKFDLRISRIVIVIPLIALAGSAIGLISDFDGFYALNSLLLTAAYGWNFVAFRKRWMSAKGTGQKLFSASLLASSLLHSHYALIYVSLHLARPVAAFGHLRYHDLYDLMLETLLAFSAMMMWMETQNERLAQLNAELHRSRQEIADNARIDMLTGLLNRATLQKMCESNEPLEGVLAVVDLDNFRDVNNALGHLTGDEVLANVGNLIRSSVRKEDLAWRWGGDEFVLFFRDQTKESVDERLRALEQRLQRFRIRGKGVLPIQLSWGSVETAGRTLRETLEEADHYMYMRKRGKTSSSKFFGA